LTFVIPALVVARDIDAHLCGKILPGGEAMSAVIDAQKQATIEDLYQVEGKAEIVNGEIVLMPPTGGDPGYAGDESYGSSRDYAKSTGKGRAVSDNKAFRVNLPNRKSFSPDAAYYVGPNPGMKFYQGAPLFAVEVRSENDYGRAAELEMAEKRRDYFAAGTLVVWDVDLLSQDVVRVYRASDPDNPTIYRRGEIAEAEPAVPGWRMPVDDLFPPPEE
jgi:Uma2 family endonuclease